MFMHAGLTVNGEKSIVWPLLGKKEDERREQLRIKN